jgi:hypothetical protein
LVLAIAASACLVTCAALHFYYRQDKNRDCNGNEKSTRNSKEAKNTAINGLGDWGRQKRAKYNDDDASFDLPQHLQRELYKEERRKASVRFLAMKKPLYDNIEMYGPDGKTMLCTIGTKKANWYVRKELAVWRDIPDCHPSIRLLFEPKNSKNCKINQRKMAKANAAKNHELEEMGNDEKLRQYNCTHKLNICVACGAKDASESINNRADNLDGNDKPNIDKDNTKTFDDDDRDGDDQSATAGLMRHYVVPYAYRKLLPPKFKTHLPHDVVLLCLDCHVDAEQAAKKQRTDVYERLYRKDPSTRLAVVIDHDRKRLKSYARALWKHKDRLPPERIKQYESAISEHLAMESVHPSGSPSTTSTVAGAIRNEGRIPEHILQELALNLQPERTNPRYIPLANLVVENLCQTDEAISKFVVGWREFFVATLRPRHLPAGWSVHSPVEIDVHPEEEGDDVPTTADAEQEP